MATRQYIGARYVPIFDGDWDNTKDYEPLVIVSYQGNSYTSRTFVPHGTAITNETYWALTGNYNAQVEAYRQEVLKLSSEFGNLDELIIENDNLVDSINDLISLNKSINGSLLLDGFVDNSYTLQGGCIVNGKIYAYFVSSDDENGLLKCFNLSNHTIEFSHSIQAYHGNGICYRSKNNSLYISSASVVSVVSLTDPDTVAEYITPVVNTTNLCYDPIEDVFYGGGSGNINKLNNDLSVVLDTIVIDDSDLRAATNVFNNNNVLVGNVIYGFGVNKENSFIFGYDITSGKRVYLAKVNNVFNGFRKLGEIEFITYENGRFILGSFLNTLVAGVHEKDLYSFIELGLFKYVPEYKPHDVNNISNNISYTVNGFTGLLVNQATDDLEPWVTKNTSYVKCIGDALTVQHETGLPLELNINAGNNAELIIGDFDIRGFFGKISSSNTITVHKLLMCCNDIHFENCHFVDAYKIGNYMANVYVGSQSKAHFVNCEFDDYDGSDASTPVHIHANTFSDVSINNSNCTFNGSKEDFTAAYGSKVVYNAGLKLHREFHNNVGYSGNGSYEKTALTFTVPVNKFYGVYLETNITGASTVPTGFAVTDSSATSMGSNNSNCKYLFDGGSSDDTVQKTPIMLLSAGTYAIWIKRLANTSSNSLNIFMTDLSY